MTHRVVVAPDKFKGTLSAREAAHAIARGVESALSDAEIEQLPLADGGEGTAEVLAPLRDGEVCVEVASTSGAVRQPDAQRATSARTGEALVGAFRARPRRVLVAVGGSSSTDAGTGIAHVAGWRFLDARGNELEPGGAALRDLARIDAGSALHPPCPVIALCDVQNPLIGERGAARTFAPQKGASSADVEVLETGLTRFAEVVAEQLDVHLADIPGAGAGGGIAAGLAAFFDAELVDGLSFIARRVGLEDALRRCDVVVTGEGRLDDGSRTGKVSTGVARLAQRLDKPVLAVCGDITLGPAELTALGFTAWRAASATDGRGAFDRAAEAARDLLLDWSGQR